MANNHNRYPKTELAFAKQSIMIIKDWDTFQIILRKVL